MDTNRFDMEGLDIAWCPGCGNFAILRALKEALSEVNDYRLEGGSFTFWSITN